MEIDLDSTTRPRAGRPLQIRDAAGVEIWRCVAGARTPRLRCDVRPARAHPDGDYVVALPDPNFRGRGATFPIHLDGREVLLVISDDRNAVGIERIRELHGAGDAQHVGLRDADDAVLVPIDAHAGRFCTWAGWMHGLDVWRNGRWWTYHRGRDCQCGRCGEIREVAPDELHLVTPHDGASSWYRVDLELRPGDPQTGCDVAAALDLPVERISTPTMAISIVDTWVVRATFRPADLALAPQPR